MHVVNRYDDELGRTSGELRSIQAERRLSAQPGRPMGRGEGLLCRIVGSYQHQIEHLFKDLVLQGGPAGTTQLKNPGLFRCLFQGFPTGGNPWDESLAPLAL